MIERQCEGWPQFYLVEGPFGLKIWSDTEPAKGSSRVLDDRRVGRSRAARHLDGRPSASSAYAEHTRGGFTTGTVGRQHACGADHAHEGRIPPQERPAQQRSHDDDVRGSSGTAICSPCSSSSRIRSISPSRTCCPRPISSTPRRSRCRASLRDGVRRAGTGRRGPAFPAREEPVRRRAHDAVSHSSRGCPGERAQRCIPSTAKRSRIDTHRRLRAREIAEEFRLVDARSSPGRH